MDEEIILGRDLQPRPTGSRNTEGQTMTFSQAMQAVERNASNQPMVLALRAGGDVGGKTPEAFAKVHQGAQREFERLLELGRRETQLPADALVLRIAMACPTLTALRRGSLPRI